MRAKQEPSLARPAAAFCVLLTRRQALALLNLNLSSTTEVPRPMKEKNESHVQTSARELPKAFVPATLAGIIAVVGTAGFFVAAVGAGKTLEGRGAGMISAAAAHLAGATITPSMPNQ
jgi:hypothetical protein